MQDSSPRLLKPNRSPSSPDSVTAYSWECFFGVTGGMLTGLAVFGTKMPPFIVAGGPAAVSAWLLGAAALGGALGASQFC